MEKLDSENGLRDTRDTTISDNTNFLEKIHNNDYCFKFNKLIVFLMTLNAGLGSFYLGWNIGVLDTVQVKLSYLFEWDRLEKNFYYSFMSSALSLGAVITAAISGEFLKYFGRKNSFIILDLFAIIGVCLTLVLNENCIIAGRLISGLCAGIYTPLVSVYVNEFVPYSISGTCGAIYECLFTFGVLCSYLFGLNLKMNKDLHNQWWRVMIGFPIAIVILNLLTFVFIFKHDTPKFLYINKKDKVGAKKALETIYQTENCVNKMLADYEKLSWVIDESPSTWDMFNKKYRLRTLIIIVLMFAEQACGINALFMYSDFIFLKTNSIETSTIYTNLIGVIIFVSSFVAIFILNKIGRRTMLLIGQIGVSIILLSLVIIYHYNLNGPIIYLFLLFTVFNGISLSPIPYIYASDLLPESGVGIGIMFNYLASFIVTDTFILLTTLINISGTFMIYLILTVISMIISYFYVKETKGLSSYEIENLFK